MHVCDFAISIHAFQNTARQDTYVASCHLLFAVDTPGTKVAIRLQKRFNNIPVSRRDNKRWFLILCETKEERGDVLLGNAKPKQLRSRAK